jgi:hypothetical protein
VISSGDNANENIIDDEYPYDITYTSKVEKKPKVKPPKVKTLLNTQNKCINQMNNKANIKKPRINRRINMGKH